MPEHQPSFPEPGFLHLELKLLEHSCRKLYDQLHEALVSEVLEHYFSSEPGILSPIKVRKRGVNYACAPDIWCQAVQSYLNEAYPLDNPITSFHKLLRAAHQRQQKEQCKKQRKHALRRRLLKPSPSFKDLIESMLQPPLEDILATVRKQPEIILQEASSQLQSDHTFWDKLQTTLLQYLKSSLFSASEWHQPTKPHSSSSNLPSHVQKGGSNLFQLILEAAKQETPSLKKAIRNPMQQFRRSVAVLVMGHLSLLVGQAIAQAPKKALEEYEKKKGTEKIQSVEERQELFEYFLEEIRRIFTLSPENSN